MANKMFKIGTALAIGVATLVTSVPAMAHGGHGRGHGNGHGYGNSRSYDDGYYRRAGYDDRSYRNNRGYDDGYRNRNYRNRRCGNGTTGLIVGAVAGGLLGKAVVGRRGDGTAGAIVGAGLGALGGRAIDRSDDRC
jgi:hypothetical protein